MKYTTRSIRAAVLTAVTSITALLAHPVYAAQNIVGQMTNSIKGFDLVNGGDNPEQKTEIIVGRVIGAFLSVFGIIFLGLMIYGGYKWMMASGREEEISTAKSTIRSAIIGLIIVLSAYAITFFVTSSLQGATN
jgi:hypothetical protein